MQKIKKTIKKIAKAIKPTKTGAKPAAKPAAKVASKPAAKKAAPIKKPASKVVAPKIAAKAVKKVEAKKPMVKADLAKAKKVADKPAEKLTEKQMATKPAAKIVEKSAAKMKPEKAKKTVDKPVVIQAEPEAQEPEEVVLTDAEGRRYCRTKECDQPGIVDGYCRYHYLLHWKKIQVRKKILTEGKLERYIEELTSRYPDKFLEILKKDLRTEKDFMAAIQELEIDESANDGEFEEETQTYIDEVRGVSGAGGGGGDEGRTDDDY